MSGSLFFRPQSALARGVQITEFESRSMNPDPVEIEEAETLLEEYLSPRRLQEITGREDLSTVTELTLKVNTTDTSLGNFGHVLPNLAELRLDDSTIPSLRDLGSSLSPLHTLWMPRCCLEELDGISSMINLVELYLSYNLISDLSPLAMCENLEILDIEGNNIDDISQVLFLSGCPRLTRLTLEGNPMCLLPHPNSKQKDYNYRDCVRSSLPDLLYLDDVIISRVLSTDNQHESLQSDWAYLDELKNDEFLENTLNTLDEVVQTSEIPLSSHGRPGSSSTRPITSIRPITSRRMNTARPGTRDTAMTSAWGARCPQTPSSADTDIGDSTSHLTMGHVVCGNPGKALLARRKQAFSPSDNVNKVASKTTSRATSIGDNVSVNDIDDVDLLAQLSEWRKHHEMIVKKIQKDKAPQVLKVTPGELASDGDSEMSDSDQEMHADLCPLPPKPRTTKNVAVTPPQQEINRNKTRDFRSRKYRVQTSKIMTKSPQKHDIPHDETSHLELDESFEIEPDSPDRCDQICSPDSGFSSAISPIGTGNDGQNVELTRSLNPKRLQPSSPEHQSSIHRFYEQRIPPKNTIGASKYSHATNDSTIATYKSSLATNNSSIATVKSSIATASAAPQRIIRQLPKLTTLSNRTPLS